MDSACVRPWDEGGSPSKSSRSHPTDVPKKTASINLVQGVFQVHGQDAPFSVVVVFLETSSDGVDNFFGSMDVFGYSGKRSFLP